MKMPMAIMHKVSKETEVVVIISFSWILIRCIKMGQDYLLSHYDIKKEDNLRERKIRTQLQFLRGGHDRRNRTSDSGCRITKF